MRPEAIRRRKRWLAELAVLSGRFDVDSSNVLTQLRAEIEAEGTPAILDHLRSCGSIPEHYGHDSSEEKLYSKYTDTVISEAFQALGLASVVLDARGDAADVQARAKDFSLVADAKAFRLSRTAKNQKDFKVQAIDSWRHDLDYAIIVAPVYQLPTRSSQIYQQAITRNVCLLSYSHLAALLCLALKHGPARAQRGLKAILGSVSLLNPTKNSVDYWMAINAHLVKALGADAGIWTAEKGASERALAAAKEESLAYLVSERDRLLGLSHQQALEELVRMAGLDARIDQVRRIQHGSLLGA